ncbi:hypothetical protein [Stutzerimonas kirkiae]|uniref:Uncharacterized protein n=1 Tax=Stutzerimonas kirkiae TaxID=2211392 RepID=A0A4Q9R441_9GAMM|nr:hypothetical protein [Stutzerimonas kirkiae]TBU93531.1 hypothetical protein DNJ96_13915 [Stutzerimonas kirkiae]TBV01737.1 hypothetical protein DNJ95_11435 [Stutzerimonas kirkiae]TBV07435.1 hypothetical protein DNK08_12925 [Stutzerimonas kirkiae]TBV11068.1 hypothetical protein DNK01_16935 [Stutzerimonas kirkiae]
MAIHTEIYRPATTLLVAGLALLLPGCASWQRDAQGVPDASVIQLQRFGEHWVGVAPDCRALEQPARRQGEDRQRWRIAFGCATYGNLAASLARPQDLAQPLRYPGMHADAAALAVTRYRENKVEALRETASTEDLDN